MTTAQLEQTVHQMVEEVVRATPDQAKARRIIYDRLKRSGALDSHAETLIAEAIKAMVNQSRGTLRKRLRSICLRGADAIASASAAASESLYATWMIGDKTLGQSTGADLDDYAGRERSSADGHLANVRFALSLRKLVGDNQTVARAIPESKAWKLLEQAQAA